MSAAPQGDKQGGTKGGGAKANDGVVTNWGNPAAFDRRKDDVNAYWIWYNDGVWRLRTTGGGKGKHRYKGLIVVAGGQLVGHRGKGGEFRGKNADQFRLNPARTAIAFDFRTDEGVDGLDFAAASGTAQLKFTLAIDDQTVPQLIRVGRAGDHPVAAVFTAPGHPPDPPDGRGKGGTGKKGRGGEG